MLNNLHCERIFSSSCVRFVFPTHMWIINIYRDAELIQSIKNLDANHCMEFSETLHRDAPVTYKITAGNSDDTKPIVLKSIMVEKYTTNTTAIKDIQTPVCRVYPNPVQTMLYVNTGSDGKACSYQIFNVSGQLLLSKSLSGQSAFEIPVGNLTKGFYYLSVNIDGQIKSLKFIKQ